MNVQKKCSSYVDHSELVFNKSRPSWERGDGPGMNARLPVKCLKSGWKYLYGHDHTSIIRQSYVNRGKTYPRV